MSSPPDVNPPVLSVSMRFLSKDPLHKSEKPYRLSYQSDRVPPTNYSREVVHDVSLYDLRDVEGSFTFEQNGITVLEFESNMDYEDFSNPSKIIESYCEDVAQVLLEYMRAEFVQVFDFNVRRRLPEYPNFSENMKPTDRSQPTGNVHLDATEPSITGLVRELNKGRAEELLQRRILYVNTWRPLRGPLEDWPLALCDSMTIRNCDLIPVDHVQRRADGPEARIVENYAVHYNPEQQWYFLSDQLPNELIVFRQVDTSGRLGVPHVSFHNPLPKRSQAFCRESIELRALVYF